MVGIIFASFISTIILNVDYNNYWRVCFIFGGLTALSAYFLRKSENCSDIAMSLRSTKRSVVIYKNNNKFYSSLYYFFTRLPRRSYASPRNDVIKFTLLHDLITIWNNKLDITRVSFAVGFSYMTYIIPFVFMNSFIPLITDISLETMMEFNTEFLIFDMFMIPIIGHLAKKLHYLKILKGTLILMILTVIPLWLFLNNASIWYVNFVRIWIIALGVAFLAPFNCWLNDLFKTADKYMLVGIGSSIGSSLIGRFSPSICLMLLHITNSSISIAVYITVISMIAFRCVKAKVN